MFDNSDYSICRLKLSRAVLICRRNNHIRSISSEENRVDRKTRETHRVFPGGAEGADGV